MGHRYMFLFALALASVMYTTSSTASVCSTADLSKILKIQLKPGKDKYRLANNVGFALEITNMSDQSQTICFKRYGSGGLLATPIERIHSFIVYRLDYSTEELWYKQPFNEKYPYLDMAVVFAEKKYTLSANKTHRIEFTWNPATVKQNWLWRLLHSETGFYRFVVPLFFSAEHKQNTSDWDTIQKASFVIKRE